MAAVSGRCRFGLFEFDPRAGELWRDGRQVKLPPQPARVLALLLAHPGDVVLRDELRGHLWGDDTFVDFERGLNFCILQVRTALGDSSDNPRFVQTVPRRGYRFIAPVTPVATVDPRSAASPAVGDVEPQPSAATPARRAEATIAAREPRTWRALTPHALLAAVVIAILAAVTWNTADRPAPAATTPPIRIVVLPVAAIGGDADLALLADGLTDDLIAELGQLSPRRLAVIARTSAMTLRGTTRTIADIGRDLDVSVVVESRLRRDGATLRLDSNVVPVAEQTAAASFNETFVLAGSAPAAASHAVMRVARSVAGALLPDSARADTRAAVSPAAWEHFIRGRALVNRGTIAEIRQAVTAFEAATAADPAFAPAWAKLAETRHLLVMIGVDRPLDAYPKAREEARRAAAGDAALADAHLALGLTELWFDWNPAAAAASFDRALALNGSSAAAHHDRAWALVALGRDDEAVAEITRARDLDPLSVRANNDIGWLYLHTRRPAEAERACAHTLALEPRALEAQACLERAYAQRGLWDAALTAARQTTPAEVFTRLSADGRDAEATLRGLWQWRLQQLEQASRQRWINPYQLAVQYALVGDGDRALAAVGRARDEKAGMMAFIARDPGLDPLRGDARFRALIANLAAPSPDRR